MRLAIPMAASMALGSPIPSGVTAIAELDAVERMRHAEVIEVWRDFGQPGVYVAVDAWMTEGAGRIDEVRLWWSDEVDRYPFSKKLRKQLTVDYDRVRPDHWRVSVAGRGERFTFDVELEDGQPAAYTDVKLPNGRRVHHCRAKSAKLYARRVLGIPVGLHSMVVICTDPDGTTHRAQVVG